MNLMMTHLIKDHIKNPTGVSACEIKYLSPQEGITYTQYNPRTHKFVFQLNKYTTFIFTLMM